METHSVVFRPSAPVRTQVDIYVEGQNPSRPVESLGLVQAFGYGSKATAEDTVRALGVRASELGCSAILRVHVDQGYGIAHAFGVCARYTEPAAPTGG